MREPAHFVVPADSLLTIALPELPKGNRALERLLEARSPLPMREIAWTAPYRDGDGQVRVALARRAYLDREAGALPYARQQRLVIRTAAGQRLFYTAPAARRRMRTTFAVVAACACISLAGLIATRAESNAQPLSVTHGSNPFASVFAGPGVLMSLAAASQGVPPDATLSAIASDGSADTAFLIADYAVDDPDTLRAAVGDAMRELGQTRLAEGGYVVSLAIPAAISAQSVARVPILAAEDLADARLRAEQQLRARATSEVLQIAMTEQPSESGSLSIGLRTVGAQANVLAFIGAVEGGRPAMRFADWRLERDPAGMALSGTLLIPVNIQP